MLQDWLSCFNELVGSMQLGTERKLPLVTALIYSASRHNKLMGAMQAQAEGKLPCATMSIDVNSQGLWSVISCVTCVGITNCLVKQHVVYVHVSSSYTCRHKNCPVFSSLSHWSPKAKCLATSQTASLCNRSGYCLWWTHAWSFFNWLNLLLVLQQNIVQSMLLVGNPNATELDPLRM